MVSVQDMAMGYIDSLKFRIQQAEKQVTELQQHLQECENEMKFNSKSRGGKPSPYDPPIRPSSSSATPEEKEECCLGSQSSECCKSDDSPLKVATQPLNLDEIDDTALSNS